MTSDFILKVESNEYSSFTQIWISIFNPGEREGLLKGPKYLSNGRTTLRGYIFFFE